MHVVVNAAMSADGKLSSRRREQIEISGPEDFARVDHLRAASDAIVVGVGTVLADDPHLTLDSGKDHPIRVVADSRARTPPDARVLDSVAPTVILVSETASDERVAALDAQGARIIEAGEERVDLSMAFAALEERGIDRTMVEGGGELIFSLFDENLVDELSVFVGSLVIGGRDAPTLADGEGFVEEFPPLELASVDRLDGGVLLHWTVD